MLRGDGSSGEHTESQGVYVNEKMVLGSFLASEHATLYGSAESDGFIWVDVFADWLSEELLEHGLNLVVFRKVRNDVKGLEATKAHTFGIRVEPPTRTMSSMSPFLSFASLSVRSTGFRVFLNSLSFSSSKRARVRVSEKSLPWWKLCAFVMLAIVLEI